MLFSKVNMNVTCIHILNCQRNHILFLSSDFNPAKTAGLDSDSCVAFSDLVGDLSGGCCRSRSRTLALSFSTVVVLLSLYY